MVPTWRIFLRHRGELSGEQILDICPGQLLYQLDQWIHRGSGGSGGVAGGGGSSVIFRFSSA